MALEGAPNAPTPERAQTLSMMFQGALEDTKNGDGFRESSGYSNLLRELASYTPEDIKGLAKVFTGISWYNPSPNNTSYGGGNADSASSVTPRFQPKTN